MPQLENLDVCMYDGIGKYRIPVIQPLYEMPKIDNWLEFEWAKNKRVKSKSTGVHFFQEDFKFESVWNFPDRYFDSLSQYGCVLAPDFSIYVNMPPAIQLYNHYRKHWLSAYWQDKGLTVIPVVNWGEEDTFEWCFDGEPINSIVATSNVGCNQITELKGMWLKGYNEMLERLHPTKILFYSNSYPEGLDGNIHFIKYNIDKSIGR